MANKFNIRSIIKHYDQRLSWLFVLIGVVILMLAVTNWSLELKPRLVREAVSNIQIMSSSRAQTIEAQFQNINNNDYSLIHNSMYELMLLNEESSKEKIFLGIELEVDYDVISSVQPGSIDLSLGDKLCQQCIKTQTPIYSRENGELIAVIKLYANPIFYQRLINDIRDQQIIVVSIVLLIILLAWFISARLVKQLKQREESLTYEISERKLIEDKLRKFATFDQLTNLPNRYLLHIEFNKKLEESQRYNKKLAVLFFDLDHFKIINDIYGHETGDALLQEVSNRISKLVRSYDLLARFGGDEFVMIMPQLEDTAAIYRVVEKIIKSFEEDFYLNNISVKVTTSIGISVFPEDGDDPSVLLKHADQAMYQAKSEGRNGYNFFTQQMNEDLRRSQWIEINLKKAIKDDLLQLYLQPQINAQTNAIESCEALLRWPQEDGSFIAPDEFIAVAERTALINEVANWVFNKACFYQQRWQELGFDPVRIDINLSAKDFVNKKIINSLCEYFVSNEKVIDLIGIEITENILLDSTPQVMSILKQLHDLNVHISIDDFGTGYSSLGYLMDFPVGCLKIDKKFAGESLSNEQNKVIIQSIIALGKGLGLSITAEGIEDEEHYDLLKELGCNLLQGYLISKPLAADEFENQYLLNKSKP